MKRLGVISIGTRPLMYVANAALQDRKDPRGVGYTSSYAYEVTRNYSPCFAPAEMIAEDLLAMAVQKTRHDEGPRRVV
jgi:hypothetical protein